MPGLLRGVARTAVVAGTATAVSNRVSRRQANRWSQQEEQQYYAQQPQYAAPPPPPQQQYYAQPAPAPAPESNKRARSRARCPPDPSTLLSSWIRPCTPPLSRPIRARCTRPQRACRVKGHAVAGTVAHGKG